MDNRKIQRINSDIYRILSVAISQKMGDADIYGVSILEVKTSADISEAKVYVDINVGSDAERDRVFNALQSTAGFLRSEIANNMKLKNTPRIRFMLDKGNDNKKRVEELLQIIKSTPPCGSCRISKEEK
jgi:ribosome-binding factor A